MALLNQDDDSIRTAASYSAQDAQWVGMQTQAQKDTIACAIDSILDTVGAENIKLFLPMWETSGTTAYDLLKRDLTFTAVGGVTLAQSGPMGYCMRFDGVNGHLRQNPVVDGEATVETSTQSLAVPTAIEVQKMKVLATKSAFVRLRLIKVGSPDGNVYVEIRTAKDSAAITNGTSAVLACSSVGVTAEWRGFTFATPPNVPRSAACYLAIRYSNNTNADGSNYIGWRYDSAGGYGQGRHYWNGAAWTDTAGEDHAFGVWSDDMLMNTDFTVFSVLKPLAVSWTLSLDCSGMETSGFFRHGINSVGYIFCVAYDGQIREVNSYHWPTSFVVLAHTFSISKATAKVTGYYNGKLVSTANGTVNASQGLLAQPLAIGASISCTGAQSYSNQNVGSVLVTSNELSAVQIGKVSHEMLCLRKFGVAV